MYVTSADLRAVRREGVLTRFAMLGPVAYVLADLPAGAAGTSLETPCIERHWGIVLQGTLRLERPGPTALAAGTAFHIPGGAPEHRFCAPDPVVVAGFAPLEATVGMGDEALAAKGFEVVGMTQPPPPPPPTIQLDPSGTTYHVARGAIDVETATMGPWLFSRATFGPLSGYTSGWCDLPHWGLVIQGDLAIAYEHGVELLSAGDVYYCPPGPPGHRFEVSDAATVMDYTPTAGIEPIRRRAEWRRVPARAAGPSPAAGARQPVPVLAGDGRASRSAD